MEQLDVLSDVAETLDRLGLPWMLVGSWASGLYGYPRMTHDIDVVLAYRESDVEALVAAFEERYDVDEYMLLDAARRKLMANIVHKELGDKVDLWPLKDEEYAQVALQRRVREEIQGVTMWVATAEDVVLSKLRWAALSQSEMQWNDVLGVVRMREDLDLRYLRHWAQALGLGAELEKLLTEAQEEAGG
ncbi:MAG: hypothetical protein ABFD96_20845 [Armatimonadia bacterium]